MFGWRLSQLGLVFFVICVNKVFNATWLINDSSRLKDKEGLASWSPPGGSELSSVSSGVRNEESRASRETGGSSLLGGQRGTGRPGTVPASRNSESNSYWNRGNTSKTTKATGRLKAEGKQDVQKCIMKVTKVMKTMATKFITKTCQIQLHAIKQKGKATCRGGRTLLVNRLHYTHKRTLARKRAHESHSVILGEQDSISSGEAEVYKAVLREKKNEIPISSFILQAATDTEQ